MKARVLTIIIALLCMAAEAWAQTYTLEIYDGIKLNSLQSNAIAALVGNGDLKMEKSGNVQTYKRSGTTLFTFNSSTSTISVPRTVTSANDFVSTALNSTAKLLMGNAFSYIAVYFSITINSQNFPNGNFLSYVKSYKDTNSDGRLSKTECTPSLQKITVNGRSISDLTGIEYFTTLAILDCYDNQLKSLDVSKNTALQQLDCHNNQLTSLNVKNTKLTVIYCYGNRLSGSSMDAFISSLPTVSEGVLYVRDLTLSTDNAMTYTQITA